MKRILLFTLLISFIGYSQNPIQPNHPNFKDGLPQDLVEKMNSVNFELGDYEMDFNPIQRVSGMKSHSFQSEMDNQSDNGITYRLDGSTDVYVGSEDLTNKYTRSYNENGDQTLYIKYDWDTDSQSFVPSFKSESTYDDDGYYNLYVTYNWNTDSQSFVPNEKYEYTYDENRNQTTVGYDWITDSQSFVPDLKEEYTNDDNGNLTTWVKYDWNTDSQSFIPNQKREYTFDENGNRTSLVYFSWSSDSQSLLPYQKNEYSFDDLNRQIINIRYLFDSNSESFIPSIKYETIHDGDGNSINSDFYWNSILEIFIPSNNETLEYDEQGRVSFKKGYQYDVCNEVKTKTNHYQYIYDDELDGRGTRVFNQDSNGDWIFHYENGVFYDENGLDVRRFQNVNLDFYSSSFIYNIEISYDTEGNNIEEIRSEWDSQTESLVLSEKEIRVYDYDFHPRYLTQFRIEKYFPGLGFKPSFEKDFSIHSETDTELVIVGTIKQYDTNFNTWSELQGEEFRSYWYYTKTPSLSTNSVESNSFSIYPNPTSNTLQINSSEYLKTPIFEIHDVKGRKVLSNPFKLTKPIDVSDLQPSMYIYNIKDGSEVKQSGKVLIE